MELTRIAGGDPDCREDDCPTVYTTDRGSIAVQGFTVDRPTPDGEAVVEIPEAVLREAFHALGW
ncbi:hypothetical protein [Kitasatospora sp. NPDC058218]|uniref:hypothetical protein n=1 Tax=Kitasatospora sp. NPDC058218 TaxID=3346385 RepID=UPI0036D87722